MLFEAECESETCDFPLRRHCFLSLHLFSSHHQEVDLHWSDYQSRFSSLLQWSRQHTALMANKNFPQNPVELKVST